MRKDRKLYIVTARDGGGINGSPLPSIENAALVTTLSLASPICWGDMDGGRYRWVVVVL